MSSAVQATANGRASNALVHLLLLLNRHRASIERRPRRAHCRQVRRHSVPLTLRCPVQASPHREAVGPSARRTRGDGGSHGIGAGDKTLSLVARLCRLDLPRMHGVLHIPELDRESLVWIHPMMCCGRLSREAHGGAG